MDIQWIIDGLAKPGKTKSGLAKRLRRAPSMVTSLLKGGRQLKAIEIQIIADYLEVSPPFPLASMPAKTSVKTAFIVGEVAAGVWTEPQIEFEKVSAHVALDDRWPEGAVFLLRVRGNSINRQARDGELVLCLDVFAAPRDFRDGDWVVAEREDAAHRIETTVKRVRNDPEGGFLLMPDSDDPNFQTPITIGKNSKETVRVRAFVIEFIKPATIF